jgi:hypothetical protein
MYNPDVLVDGIDYKINLIIEKYHTQKALDDKMPDEVLNIPGNCLTNKGINLIWKLVADASLVADGTDGRYEWAFTNATSYIGVGNADNTAPSSTSALQALATNTMLYAEEHYNTSDIVIGACHYCYMKMNDTYPLSGDNQKIVFQSTFLPGVACFNWYEWCIANGNGNRTNAEMENDPYIIRQTAWGIADGNDIDDVAPDPIPSQGTSYSGNTDDRVKKTLLNHRFESMGRKYASATWIITVEVSLS